MGSSAGVPDQPDAVVRVSDAERDRTIRALRDRSVEGRLSHDTFIRRVEVALRAQRREELDELVTDLPPGRLAHQVTRAVSAASSLVTLVQGAWRAPRLPRLLLPPQGSGKLMIGRAAGCDLTLADITVSRYHAELYHDGSDWILADLGSMNGVRVNGWRVSGQTKVRPGDHVSFGRISFRLARR